MDALDGRSGHAARILALSRGTSANTYNAVGDRTRITYPDSKTVDYTFDGNHRMSTVTDWLSKQTAYSYDNAGKLTVTTYPTASPPPPATTPPTA